jgi:hypothetical protein
MSLSMYMLYINRNQRNLDINQNSTSKKTDTKTSIKHSALTLGTLGESATALTLTNQRFHIQSNKINGTAHKLQVKNIIKGYQFFPVVRLIQFSSMLQAKEWGIQQTETSKILDPKTAGAICSSLAGLPFNYPMECILLDGVQATHQQQPFSLPAAGKKLLTDAAHGKLRGFGATMIRDLPFGAAAVTLPEIIEKQWGGLASNYMSVSSIKTAATLFSAAVFCIATQPADVIKTSIQNNSQLPNNMIKAGKKIVADRGKLALFSGLSARYSKVAATFLILNNGVSALEKWMTGKDA